MTLRDLVGAQTLSSARRPGGAATWAVPGSNRFVCGPPGMVDTAESALRALGIDSAHVRVERHDLA